MPYDAPPAAGSASTGSPAHAEDSVPLPPGPALAGTPAPPPPGPVAGVAPRYGGFWRRFFAWWIDGILLWIAGGLIRVGLGVDLFDIEWGDPRMMLAGFGSTIVAWLYCALLESSGRQATLGQQILGIKVTDLQLRRISFARATGRHFAQILSVLTLFVGYLMIAFTSRKQGLHDMLAGCLVLRGE